MECVKRVDAFQLSLRDMCNMIKEEFDAMSIREVQKEAETKGVMDGLKEGKKEGKKEAIERITIQMYEHGLPVKDIAAITKQSEKQVKSILARKNHFILN